MAEDREVRKCKYDGCDQPAHVHRGHTGKYCLEHRKAGQKAGSAGNGRRSKSPEPNDTKVTPRIVRELAGIHCTIQEAAAVIGVHENILTAHMHRAEIAEAWLNGRLNGKASLRRLEWKHAQRPDRSGVQMTIHLAKHWLGEKDAFVFSFADALRDIDKLTDTQLAEVVRIQKEALDRLRSKSPTFARAVQQPNETKH